MIILKNFRQQACNSLACVDSTAKLQRIMRKTNYCGVFCVNVLGVFGAWGGGRFFWAKVVDFFGGGGKFGCQDRVFVFFCDQQGGKRFFTLL